MQKKEIKRKLNKMVVNSTPNVLDDVLAKCESENLLKKKEIKMMEKQKNKFLIPKLAGALVVIVVCIGGLLLFRNQNRMYDSEIYFDVNPSIELKIDKDREVISAVALNDDGMKVLDNMNLKDADLIRNKYVALIYIVLSGNTNIQAGNYELNRNMSTEDIIKSLANGDIVDAKRESVNITFKEGITLEEYLELLSENTNL